MTFESAPNAPHTPAEKKLNPFAQARRWRSGR